VAIVVILKTRDMIMISPTPYRRAVRRMPECSTIGEDPENKEEAVREGDLRTATQ